MPTPEPNFHDAYHIRKWMVLTDDTLANENGLADGGKVLRKVLVAALVRNPYSGVFSDDLSRIVGPSPLLGEAFADRLKNGLQGQAPQSHGKAALVGAGGELEHGKAFLTTASANQIRDAFGACAWVPSTVKHGGPGTSIDVPLACNDALYVRSHYDTLTVAFPDGPLPGEIAVIFAVATRGRIHARLGGLSHADRKGDGLH